MGYNAIDLVDKAIDTSNRILNFYEEIGNYNNIGSFKIFLNVFKKQQNQKKVYYESLKKQIEYKEINEIDFFSYDKISSLITQFNSKISFHNCGNNTKQLIECVLDISKDVRALFIDVRGRIIKNKDGWDSAEYEVLTSIIEMEERYANEIEKLYKKTYKQY